MKKILSVFLFHFSFFLVVNPASAQLRDFYLEWSGVPYGNNASVAATLTIDMALFKNPGGNGGAIGPGNVFNNFSMNILGSANPAYNGSRSASDFNAIYLDIGSDYSGFYGPLGGGTPSTWPLNLNANWVGQQINFNDGIVWGVDGISVIGPGPGVNNLHIESTTPNAPSTTFYYNLTLGYGLYGDVGQHLNGFDGESVRLVSITSFRKTLNQTVSSNSSFLGLTTQSAGLGARGTIGTIRSGGNFTANPVSVDMSFEKNPNYLSDVLSVTGIDGIPHLLEMSYDSTGLGASESNLANGGQLYLSWLDPSDISWKNAVLGNHHGSAAATPYLGDPDGVGGFAPGSWDNFVLEFGVTDSNLSDFLGRWGVDTDNNVVWAVIDHNSEFAVIPEPGLISSVICISGLSAICLMRRRKMHT